MKQRQVRRHPASVGRYRPFILSDGTANASIASASARSTVTTQEKPDTVSLDQVSNPAPAEVPGPDALPVIVSTENENSSISIGDRLHNVTRWLIFSVLVALLPIILVTISLPLHRLPVTFENTLSHGELLLVSTAILGEAIGDLILNRKANRFLKVVIVGLNVVVFV